MKADKTGTMDAVSAPMMFLSDLSRPKSLATKTCRGQIMDKQDTPWSSGVTSDFKLSRPKSLAGQDMPWSDRQTRNGPINDCQWNT